MRIAFAGNPNSGKTTMYNALTGRNERVGNWAGVTVDKKEAPIRKIFTDGEDMIAVDLPGAYSMSPFTAEESVTKAYIINEKPDVIVNIVDATNLSRSLFFTTQLLELGIPMVVALNKADVNRKKSTVIDTAALSGKLGCPVVETVSVASGHDDLREVIRTAVSLVGKEQIPPYVQPQGDLTSKREAEAADRKRFAFVNRIVSRVESRRFRTADRNAQDKIDAVLTHPVGGIGIFALVMFLVFDLSQSTIGPWLADTLVGWLEQAQDGLAQLAQNMGVSEILQALLIDGVVGGVIAVIGFLPLVMVMYFLMALLEDCGYMARVSVVLDPIFKKVGLSGKSVIPFVVGTGCAVPGVMACRTIRNERERRATAMLTPFMPCGAKLPIIGLFAGTFFEDASWVGTMMYFAGIVLIFLGALLVNAVTGRKGKKSYFIMELPEYKLPSLKRAFFSMCSRGWSFIVKATTVILLCNTAVQVMQSFTWSLQPIAEGAAETAILATIAKPFAYALIPVVGYYSWQLAAAAVTGLIAKENVVGTLAVCFGVSSLFDLEALTVAEGAGDQVAAVFGLTKAAALAYLVFNLFSPPCFAALGAMNSELKSGKWMMAGIGLQLGVGFTAGILVYQIGTLITTGSFGPGLIPGVGIIATFAAVIVALIQKTNRELAREKTASGRK